MGFVCRATVTGDRLRFFKIFPCFLDFSSFLGSLLYGLNRMVTFDLTFFTFKFLGHLSKCKILKGRIYLALQKIKQPKIFNLTNLSSLSLLSLLRPSQKFGNLAINPHIQEVMHFIPESCINLLHFLEILTISGIL